MKIVYMTYGIHYSGGMERVLSVKANYFAEVLEYEVYIVITDGKGRSPFCNPQNEMFSVLKTKRAKRQNKTSSETTFRFMILI